MVRQNVLVILGDVRNAVPGSAVEVGGVEERVAIELEDIAVEVVGAGLDRGAHDAAGVAVVLGVERAFDQVELVDGVEIRREMRVLSEISLVSAPLTRKLDCWVCAPLTE